MNNFSRLIIIAFLICMVAKPTYALDRFFEIQAIDTMKYSRDKARSEAKDETFDNDIAKVTSEIQQTGATHIAIATPYDEEFVPFMKRWVQAARQNNLKVWFRGNMSGWEGWFGYSKIDRTTHTKDVKAFILAHPDLFEDGDVFSSCPECENGGPGDPRHTGDVSGFRNFLVKENSEVQDAFKTINKNVITNYYSMNGDVARLVMDPDTTSKLGGYVTIDHYVPTPDKLVNDSVEIAKKSGGSIVLGEWGAPIPDIHGEMTDEEQANWIESALEKIITHPEISVVNYWTSVDSSTAIWTNDGNAKPAVAILKKYFKPFVLSGKIMTSSGEVLSDVTVTSQERTMKTLFDGSYSVPLIHNETIHFVKDGYKPVRMSVKTEASLGQTKDIVMQPGSYTFFDKIYDYILAILGK